MSISDQLFSNLTTPLLFFCVALVIRSIFSFLETSITALRLFKLKELALANNKYEALFQAMEKTPHRVLITILVASSVADVTAAALATSITETIFSRFNLSSGLGFSAGIGFASIAIIIFGEIIPKNLAKRQGKSERIFKSLLWLISFIYYLLSPLVSLLLIISDTFLYYLNGKTVATSSEWISSEKEIQFLIGYIHEKGLIEPEKTEMLQNIFEIGYTPIKEIMVPATDIVSINVDTSIQETLQIFSEFPFTRLPVYQESQDNIIGMVHQKDVFIMLHNHDERPLKEIVRPVLFVPESMKVNQLLRELRQQQMHLAIVLNEHGSVMGLITLEDVLEEIVGEINDEHEPTSQKILALPESGWLVDASVPLEDIEKLLNITLESEESVTLGGFLAEQLQHLPKKGEQVLYKHYFFQVQKASPKRVRQVLIFKEDKTTT
jgi:putative hemolysin